jgi:hypothetical protein
MGDASENPLIPRNATLNLLSPVILMFVTLATVPPYLRLFGDVRFTVLGLVWMFLSYPGCSRWDWVAPPLNTSPNSRTIPGQHGKRFFGRFCW